ncbi:hypothetical protein FRC09_007128 [Ceratobasidium sp. 395]|nr:hypothetical protein FRC09_007128 [Ceratobasidium sp. 395]
MRRRFVDEAEAANGGQRTVPRQSTRGEHSENSAQGSAFYADRVVRDQFECQNTRKIGGRRVAATEPDISSAGALAHALQVGGVLTLATTSIPTTIALE